MALERHRSPDPWSLGSTRDLDTAKAEFKAAWKALKESTTSEQVASAYKAMHIRDDRRQF